MAGTITHKWNGTILTITSDSGTSACDLKGEKGDDGVRGPQGLPGNAAQGYLDTSAEGELLRVSDAATGLANGAVSYITATQDGRTSATLTHCINLLDTETITYPALYINGSSFVGISAGRTITIPCEPNTHYTLIKALPSTTRIATSPDYPAVGGTNTVNKSGNAQTTTLTITSGANDKYLTIQLWASGETNSNTETHLQTLRVYKTNDAQTLTAELPATIYGGFIEWHTGILTETHNESLEVMETPNMYVLDAGNIILQKGYNTVWSDCGNTKLSYKADTKLYIDGKFNALQNAVVSLGGNI